MKRNDQRSDGDTVLITGATGGIGLATARALARLGATVVIGARDAVRGQAIVDRLTSEGHRAELVSIDMASQASVRRAAETYAARHPKLDVLINNAGIVTRQRGLSPEGYELTWATNFLGGFLLTRLLLPTLKRAARPRIINVTSDAHRVARIFWEDLGLEHDFRSIKAYAQSKLAQILFTRELARREPGVSVNAVHPGAIATNIWRAAPQLVRLVLAIVLPSANKGARPIVRLVVARELDGVTGRYFDRLREATPARAALSDADAARLWDIAEQATRTRDLGAPLR
jgi:retinol dehydrogenase 12